MIVKRKYETLQLNLLLARWAERSPVRLSLLPQTCQLERPIYHIYHFAKAHKHQWYRGREGNNKRMSLQSCMWNCMINRERMPVMHIRRISIDVRFNKGMILMVITVLHCVVCMCNCAGEASHIWFVAMDQKQSTACSDGRWSIGRHRYRVCSASSQPQRRSDHAHLVSRRRADEDAQDDHSASHHIKPHLRYSGWVISAMDSEGLQRTDNKSSERLTTQFFVCLLRTLLQSDAVID